MLGKRVNHYTTFISADLCLYFEPKHVSSIAYNSVIWTSAIKQVTIVSMVTDDHVPVMVTLGHLCMCAHRRGTGSTSKSMNPQIFA